MAGFKLITKLGQSHDIRQEFNIDYGFGPIDIVWNFKFHPDFVPITCGFIELKEQEGGSKDLDDGQFSLRKIEEAIMTGMRSGMDRLFLFCSNEDVAKSVAGQIQWFSSKGGLIRYDSYCQVLFAEKEHLKVANVERNSSDNKGGSE